MFRRRIHLIVSVAVLFLIVFAGSMLAQSGTDKVRLFQSYFLDAPIAKTNHVQPGLSYATSKQEFMGKSFSVNTLMLGANGGYAVNEKLEILGGLNYISISSDGEGEGGLSDLAVYARYALSDQKETQISAGGLLTLPIGSEDIGQGALNFGGYSAIRHHLDGGIVITGNLALIFYEAGDDRNTSMEISTGLIYPMDNKINLVGEFVIKSEFDQMMLSAGADYDMGNGRVRGALGLGLDDGSPDFQIMAGYLMAL